MAWFITLGCVQESILFPAFLIENQSFIEKFEENKAEIQRIEKKKSQIIILKILVVRLLCGWVYVTMLYWPDC